MQLTDCRLVVVALLLIGLTQISFVKNYLGRDQSSFRLSALEASTKNLRILKIHRRETVDVLDAEFYNSFFKILSNFFHHVKEDCGGLNNLCNMQVRKTNIHV
jgi:hypothetical protein